LETKKVRKQAG